MAHGRGGSSPPFRIRATVSTDFFPPGEGMSVEASSLQISVEEGDRWRRNMSVTVPASVVREEEARAAKQLASRARLKGFRKGRVPAGVRCASEALHPRRLAP